MKMNRIVLVSAAALLMGGCATSAHLTLMPRDSGKLYQGTASNIGGSEGPMTVTIENRTYTGTWVQVTPDRTYGYTAGGWGSARWGGWGLGGYTAIDNPEGGSAKALLQTSDGAGLRCDLRGSSGGGGGVCRDDAGKEYDVQVRAVRTPQ